MVPRYIQETVWGSISFGCKMNLITICGILNRPRYQQEIFERSVIPHFDNNPVGPIFMDDNARPHRTRAVTQFLHENAAETIPWPAMSPDLNPIDILSHCVQQRDPPVQTLNELTAALHEEWNRIPQNEIQRLIQEMRRHLEAFVRV